MNFPKYWAKGSHTGTGPDGREMTLEAYGWSEQSVDEAKALGGERARRAIERGFLFQKRREYDYGDAPLREEVVDRIQLEGRTIALITRNRYGALVLNTARVMFVDVDFPRPPRPPPVGILQSLLLLLGRGEPPPKPPSAAELGMQRLTAWAAAHPDKSLRIYRTRAGLRLLFTDALYQARSPEVAGLLESLGSDPLYRRLTERQDCFRARLTPKPWRCGQRRPPAPYPLLDDTERAAHRQWETTYHETIKAFAVCRLLETVGSPAGHPEVEKVIAVHDALTLDGDKPLA
ncbi:MAG: hypothetical protein EA425_07555 [Puniceicoccaceae bacterium]|nr:MAG: hypothetical protein EA425_07555 [Puniceicoccaceae bacterium]